MALYRDRYEPMVRLAFLLVGSSGLAEEAVQESFLKVRKRIGGLEHPSAYLRATVVNECRNHHRRARIERRDLPLHAQPSSSNDEVNELADALGALPYRQRAVIVLRYYLGASEVEIADYLGCRPGTVKSLAHRGLAALREMIEP
ncbi:MAG: SigE family RNA polymerase sigma factor [Acidimicrobiales bacterium]